MLEPNKKLRIAQVAPLWTSIPPASYGGIELVVSLLTEELARRGHDVTLFASGDSKTSARLRSILPINALDAMARGEAYDYEIYANANLAEALAQAGEFDLIHSHIGLACIPFASLSSTPVVHTAHTLLGPDDRWLLARHPAAIVTGVSHSQLSCIDAQRRARMPVIHNGCNFDAFREPAGQGEYLAFLGRMAPNKNPVAAIRIAQAVGMPLLLAGKPQTGNEEAYFKNEVEPLIDGTQIRYIGPVNQERKRDFLAGAAAFLFPTSWPEPFGIVMIEAMASGLPVIAFKTGSVPEAVDYGITGVYAETVEELAALVPEALKLDRRVIRDHARKRFSHQSMVDRYLAVYGSLSPK
jgi:glycosyltransferase involved in cell wall biosynthesis